MKKLMNRNGLLAAAFALALTIALAFALGGSQNAAAQTATATPTPTPTSTPTPKGNDSDGDGLIEISTVDQLDAMRYDFDGDGIVASGSDGSAAYNLHFAAHENSGCPDGADALPNCIGYELIANLSLNALDDNLDGVVSGEEEWTPIAGWNTTFNGNGYDISDLTLTTAGGSAKSGRKLAGLFASIDASGVVRNIGLTNVTATFSGYVFGGLLAGENSGTIETSFAKGSVTYTSASPAAKIINRHRASVGGLVGRNARYAKIEGSWADVALTVNADGVRSGGLIGDNRGGEITACFAYGATAIDTGTTASGQQEWFISGGFAGLNMGDKSVIRYSHSGGGKPTGKTGGRIQPFAGFNSFGARIIESGHRDR